MSQKLLLNISAPKTASTNLFFALIQSDRIAQPKIKEPRFFMEDIQIDNVPEALVPKGNNSYGIKWFLDLFGNTKSDFLIDFTTYYFLSEKLRSNAEKDFNDIRYFMLMRDPFDRIISHYYQYDKMGIEIPPIEEVFLKKNDLGEFFRKFNKSSDLIKKYEGEKLAVIDMKDIVTKDENLKHYINSFLGTDDFMFSEEGKNKRGVSKSKFVNKIIFNSFNRKIKNVIPKSVFPSLIQFRKKIISANTQKSTIGYTLTPENCYFYDELMEERNFYNNYKYSYKGKVDTATVA